MRDYANLRQFTRIYASLRESAQDHHEADALDVLDVLAKTPGLYLVPELRYPCHCCRPCCCRRPCHFPPPRRPPPYCRHHHEVDALDVLDVHAKTPSLYQVPKLRNLNLIFFDGGTTDAQVTYTIRWSRIKIKMKHSTS